MAVTKRTDASSKLAGFQTWFQEHMRGFKLELGYKQIESGYRCALRVRKRTIAQGQAPTQKAAAEAAAENAVELFKGDPEVLRALLRSDAPPAASEPSGDSTASSNAIQLKRVLKTLKSVTEKLEETTKLLHNQDRELKKLRKQVAELQGLETAAKCEQLTSELAGVPGLIKSSEQKVLASTLKHVLELKAAQAARAEALERHCAELDERVGAVTAVAAEQPVGSILALAGIQAALDEWLPESALPAAAVLALLLAGKICVAPSLALVRALELGLGPDACKVEVLTVEPGWSTWATSCRTACEAAVDKARAFPSRLQILCLEGCKSRCLETWLRPASLWSTGLVASLPNAKGPDWPENFRIVLVPDEGCQLEHPMVLNLVMLSCNPDRLVEGLHIENTVKQIWASTEREPQATWRRVQAALRMTGHPDQTLEAVLAGRPGF